MPMPLPAIVSDYLAASDRRAVDEVVACFTEDAVVSDEDQKWHGHAAIRRWRETVASVYDYTVEILGSAALGDEAGLQRHEVYTRLDGNFPGGRVDLTDRFALRNGRIASLEIVPTEW